MMDLTVEIHGDIGTLKEALARFTATEILDGENKYQCNRCKSYERAKKKLSVLEAPNVLTIALKRFQSGKFGKLNKAVRFPEHLDLAPYMSGTDDKSPVYSLYAVVVHQDVMNAAFSGHYICYVKSTQGKWYKTDDTKVKPVEIERVLTENAYMLLYARCSPRAPSLIRDATSHYHLRSKKNRHKESFFSGPQLRSQDRPPYYPHHRHSSIRPSDLFKDRLPFPETDSSSDCSSLSYSDEMSCSTESTRDSTSTDEYSDYIDSGRFSWSQSSGFSEDSDSLGYSPLTARHSAGESESLSYGERLGWERGEGLSSEGRGRLRFLYPSTTNQCRKLTEENRERESNELMRSSTTRQRRAHEFY
ncbi:ubiquitin carboxyl-terminal hydrolase 17-like [Iris pallida]|nr:ubiquitin carboxyl-terminal hydrolase 17-like [Iris pallida]